MLNLMDYFGRTEVYGRDWVLLDKHRLSTCSVCSVRVDMRRVWSLGVGTGERGKK